MGQLGFAISVILHAVLLAWAMITIQRTPELAVPEPEAISVAIVTASELTRMRAGDETVKELEAKAETPPQQVVSQKEADKPKPITAPEPPAAEPEKAEPEKTEAQADAIADKLAALEQPAPGPTPEELKKVEEEKKAEAERQKAEEEKKRKEAERKKKAEEEKKRKQAEAEKKKKEEAKRKEEEEKKKTAADRLAALIDKDPTKRGAPPAAAPEPETLTDYKGPAAGTRDGKDTELSAREEDLLKSRLSAQLRNCWKLPGGGGGGSEVPAVTIKWRLRPDGSLDGDPQVVEAGSGAFAGLAVEAALRAVRQCQPFTLPPESYGLWKEVNWVFDPSRML